MYTFMMENWSQRMDFFQGYNQLTWIVVALQVKHISLLFNNY